MVLVNSVVLVRGTLGLSESAQAWTMFSFGAGSMTTALVLPRVLDAMPDQQVTLSGAALMIAALLGLALTTLVTDLGWPLLLGTWVMVGLGYSAVLTPSGRLLRRSAHAEDRAAQFALSHACWLVTYPLSGWLLTVYGVVPALIGLGFLAAAGMIAALKLWQIGDPVQIEHTHDNLPLDHPDLNGHRRHSHPMVIDESHPRWAARF